ncbi:MAG TPA: CobD/CbiB family protein [Noviherbaspirillum sp.]|jgi:adenosylcobinamide-phosphate synthase|uniref:CobD/CbiB family protein n=1 Tax=Noviherbaspirillum sp. TaxID=1926288 RepID=UPI002F921FBB
MTFLSILLALLFEQFKPLRADNPVYAAIKQLAARMEATFNAGQEGHGRMAWFVTMLLLLVPTILVYWLSAKLSPVLALAWNVLVVYLTLGFRRYSHYFTSIQLALNAGDDTTARKLLAEWTHQDTTGMSTSEVSRIAVEKALVTTHRNVFGVFFWFAMPLGPAGAILYRVAEFLARAWNEPDHLKNEPFGRFATRAFYVLDWVPARLTAIAFAVVGNFEDAIYAWRNFAHRWQDEAMGIILSAGGGAMGLRLGSATENAADLPAGDVTAVDAIGMDAGSTPVGEEATARALQSTVGLVWRALLLWMLLLLLLSFAVWLG